MDITPSGSYFVYPTLGPGGAGIGVEPFKGSCHSELQLGATLSALAAGDFVHSGLDVPASSASLVLALPAGVAMIDGRVVTVPGATNLTCSASTTTYGFLKLTKDSGGYVTATAFELNTTGVAPTDSVPLFSAAASGTAVTSTKDLRPVGAPRGRRCKMAVYSAAGTFDFIPEFTGPHNVLVIGAGGSGGAGYGHLNTTTNYASGGGGGSGAATFGSADLVKGVPSSVVVGAGGAVSGLLQVGQPGQQSTFETLSANGGQPGTRASLTVKGTGGAGGTASAFSARSISVGGATGADGQNASGGASLAGGNGAQSPYFAGLLGGAGIATAPGSSAGSGSGSGGSGGWGQYASGITAGLTNYTGAGTGAPGLVIIFW